MPYSYKSLIHVLQTAGIAEAADEAALLLERFAGCSQVTLMSERDRIFSSPELDAAVARRLERFPLQYILGEWEFYGLPFWVDEHCLIPRPDTECLVERAIRIIPPEGRFADLCTGSGCIAVATLARRPDLKAVALELYPATLELAVKNAVRNGVAERFIPLCADLLQEGVCALADMAPFDAILSNPPYIPTAVLPSLSPEVQREPLAALDGGKDGLVFYRAILEKYVPLLKPGGQLLLEIGYDQADSLRELCAAYLPTSTVEIFQDLGGNPRVVQVTLPTDGAYTVQ